MTQTPGKDATDSKLTKPNRQVRQQAKPKPTERREVIAFAMASESFQQKYGPWALVTGASSGLGAEFCRQLAAKGLHIVAVARREELLRNLCGEIQRETGREARMMVADLSTKAGVQSVIRQTDDLDIGLLVNNAGVTHTGSFFSAAASEVDQLMSLNVHAPTILSHAIGERLARRRAGGILFVSSIASRGMAWMAAYSASKSYVSCLARTLNDELRRWGVSVMALEPGFVRTDMTRSEDGSYSLPLIIDADYCVRETLAAFGRSLVFTPGLLNRIAYGVLAWLPHSVFIRLQAEVALRQYGSDLAKLD